MKCGLVIYLWNMYGLIAIIADSNLIAPQKIKYRIKR